MQSFEHAAVLVFFYAVLPQIVQSFCFGVFWMRTFFAAVPASLEEAPRIDFLLSLVMITSADRRTAPLALSFFQGAHLTQYALLDAAAMIVVLPLIVLYAFLQRYFIRGMLSGAVNG